MIEKTFIQREFYDYDRKQSRDVRDALCEIDYNTIQMGFYLAKRVISCHHQFDLPVKANEGMWFA